MVAGRQGQPLSRVPQAAGRTGDPTALAAQRRCSAAFFAGREVAARLGIQPWVATYRLDKAVELKLVERLGGGLYRVTDVVPEL